jgi:hypothetical protein
VIRGFYPVDNATVLLLGNRKFNSASWLYVAVGEGLVQKGYGTDYGTSNAAPECPTMINAKRRDISDTLSAGSDEELDAEWLSWLKSATDRVRKVEKDQIKATKEACDSNVRCPTTAYLESWTFYEFKKTVEEEVIVEERAVEPGWMAPAIYEPAYYGWTLYARVYSWYVCPTDWKTSMMVPYSARNLVSIGGPRIVSMANHGMPRLSNMMIEPQGVEQQPSGPVMNSVVGPRVLSIAALKPKTAANCPGCQSHSE